MISAHRTARGDRPDRGSPAGAPATSAVDAGHGTVTGDQTDRPARVIMVTGARGGQGTTTVAVALAFHAAAHGEVALVAASNEGADVLLGVPAIERGGAVQVTRNLTLAVPPATVAADTVVIDGARLGTRPRIAPNEAYVVLRGPCYVALATLLACHAEQPDGIIVVAEEGRSLTVKDVSEVTGLPVVAVCAELGFDSYRFSLEWSRIEPEPGEWSTAAIDNYRRQCEALLERGLDPVVTFHHFTTPRWVTAGGGWRNADTADRFASFAARAAAELGDVVRRACTINEPNVVSVMGYFVGMFPPGGQDESAWKAVNEIFVDAHRKAVDAIRANAPGVPVGLTLSMTDYQAVDGGEQVRDEMRANMEDVFLAATTGDDFLGVQTYSRSRIGPKGVLGPEAGVDVLDMGYEYWPDALAATIRRAWEVTKGEMPILVTENGIGTKDDEQRIQYVRTALEGVLDCVADGIDVGGYTYWSLLDNFEWMFGYGPHFGLVEVDRTAPFARRPKPSAQWLAGIVQAERVHEGDGAHRRPEPRTDLRHVRRRPSGPRSRHSGAVRSVDGSEVHHAPQQRVRLG